MNKEIAQYINSLLADRERSCFADQDLKLVRHDHKTSWSLLADAEKALAEIVQQRFEEQAQ